jgi:hypothetical protein
MTPEPAYIELSTSRGIRFWVDIEDYPKIRCRPWWAQATDQGTFYLTSRDTGLDEDGHKWQRSVQIARLIMGLESGNPLVVGHINGEPRDNRKINLRVCTQRDNARNRRISCINTSGFKGVSQLGLDCWAAVIRVNGHAYHLGTFDSAEKAYQAYCEAAAWAFGQFANFGEVRDDNFRLPSVPRSVVMPPRLADKKPMRRRLAEWTPGIREEVPADFAGHRHEEFCSVASSVLKPRTQRARAGLGVWGLSKSPLAIRSHFIFS